MVNSTFKEKVNLQMLTWHAVSRSCYGSCYLLYIIGLNMSFSHSHCTMNGIK